MDISIDDELIERILLDLKNVLKKDPLIDEFDILPVHESIQNKSPVIHVSNKLALEDWCVKPLYVYVYNKFFAWKLKKFKVDPDTLFIWTSSILLINPEIETAWNARKELCCSEGIGVCSNIGVRELKFSELVLSRKPKSSPTFAHRKWVLLRLSKSGYVPSEIIKQEFFVCSRVASLYANNYYAWSHRSWIIQELLQTCLKSVSEELTRTSLWVSTHISDHSGFHYRQFLLSCYRTVTPKLDSWFPEKNCYLHESCLIEEENAKCFSPLMIKERLLQLIDAIHREMLFLSNLQTTFLGHETLWYHRRYLLHEIKLCDSNEESCSIKLMSLDGAVQNKRHKSECDLTMNWNITNEENFLKQCILSSADNDWEQTLIRRHLKWLNNVLLWPVSITLS